MYKQSFPDLGLSLENGTEDVPQDGRYHVLLNGEIVYSALSRAHAEERYRKLKAELLPQLDNVSRETVSMDVREALRREREMHDVDAVTRDTVQRIRRKAAGQKGRRR